MGAACVPFHCVPGCGVWGGAAQRSVAACGVVRCGERCVVSGSRLRGSLWNPASVKGLRGALKAWEAPQQRGH